MLIVVVAAGQRGQLGVGRRPAGARDGGALHGHTAAHGRGHGRCAEGRASRRASPAGHAPAAGGMPVGAAHAGWRAAAAGARAAAACRRHPTPACQLPATHQLAPQPASRTERTAAELLHQGSALAASTADLWWVLFVYSMCTPCVLHAAFC